MPGEAGYEMLVKKTKAAVEKTDSFSGRIYLIWLQGESDAIAGKDTDTYINLIKELAHALETDIGLSRFGVIRVGRFTNDERDDAIIEAQSRVCNEDDLFLMLTDEATQMNEIPEYMNPEVGGHFSALGLKKLGCDAAKTLVENIK